ncbi:hypothetical protein [Cognatiyoonia sp. IB215182]|uniref:hypothetical protein n=1 Tax=Cognatiyoonia sp. IB215182 TaxID=3097353 RepID=UPI002A0B3CB3|nr:hypothetical protein [Cognatiyoonia sp. IB215182]MDX8353663.1 hypothetical protein [Cognatiyoonia sp. IB215182]
MSIASYRKLAYAIKPGATQGIDRQGDFFHVLRADGAFSVAWDDDAATPFFAGLEYEVRDGRSFNKVQIVNKGQDVLNIEVGIGSGGIRDSRLTTSGPVDARDNGGASFGDVVNAAEAAQWLNMDGYRWDNFEGGDNQMVRRDDNDHGIEILHAQLSSGSASTARLVMQWSPPPVNVGPGGIGVGQPVIYNRPLLQVSNGASTSIARVRLPRRVALSYDHGGDGSALCIAYRLL